MERIRAILRHFHRTIIKQMNIITKMQKIIFTKNYYMQPYKFYILSLAIKQLPEKLNSEFLHAFNFSCT